MHKQRQRASRSTTEARQLRNHTQQLSESYRSITPGLIQGRSQKNIARAKLCRWHQSLAACISPIAEAIFQEIVAEAVIGIDDTVHRLVDAELHRCKQGRLWAVTGNKASYYVFSETREGI